MTTPSLSSDLLARYLAGDATALESVRVQQWIDADPRRTQLLQALRQLDVRSDDRTTPPSLADLWATIDARAIAPTAVTLVAPHEVDAISANGAAGQRAKPMASRLTPNTVHVGTRYQSPVAPPLLRGWVYGALTAFVVGVIGLLTLRSPSWQRATHETASAVYATSSGQLAVVTLRDGSRVTLAPRSRLVVSPDFGVRNRAMTLQGEAHFEVAPQRNLAFTVTTGAVVTRVLGTTFDIRRYHDDSVGRVIVMSGKVAIGARTGSMTLAASMAGRFTDSAVTGAMADDSTMYTDWNQGRLIFRDAPVPLILATLHEWYGYEFRLSDTTMAKLHASAIFVAGDTHEMFAVVEHMLKVSMTRQDSVVTLHPIRNAASPDRPGLLRQHSPFSKPTEVGR